MGQPLFYLKQIVYADDFRVKSTLLEFYVGFTKKEWVRMVMINWYLCEKEEAIYYIAEMEGLLKGDDTKYDLWD
jgi:hypothetical protein